MNRKTRRALSTRIVEEAERHVGYHAQPERRSVFQASVYSGKAWNGAFVNRVLRDAFGEEPEVNFTSTVAALGFYWSRNRVYRKPQVGDIVFMGFASDPLHPFEQPHVGVVISTDRWKVDGVIRTVEAEVSTGRPQGIQLADGVHERQRYATDVIGFVRPVSRGNTTVPGEPPVVKMSYFDSNGKTVARTVTVLQRALGTLRPGWTFREGKRDGVFKSALGRYSRETGMVENRGEVTYATVRNLANEAGFGVEP